MQFRIAHWHCKTSVTLYKYSFWQDRSNTVGTESYSTRLPCQPGRRPFLLYDVGREEDPIGNGIVLTNLVFFLNF